MHQHEFDIQITLSFKGLTMEEVTKLERYIHEGLHGKDWGDPHSVLTATLTGSRSLEKNKKGVSKEDLLALEKKGVTK